LLLFIRLLSLRLKGSFLKEQTQPLKCTEIITKAKLKDRKEGGSSIKANKHIIEITQITQEICMNNFNFKLAET
jgi:hypothetical protein